MGEYPDRSDWLEELRRIHDESFDFDWTSHLQGLNTSLELADDHELAVPAPGLPPSWFVGDVESLTPGAWVLVVSLNQARRQEDEAWHVTRAYNQQSYWDQWRFLNRDWWEPKFYRRLVRLASEAMQTPVVDESEFATSRMVLVELCPYPSRSWGLGPDAMAALFRGDPGFTTATRVRDILVGRAHPALVIVNGLPALTAFRQASGPALVTSRREYASAHQPSKTLWHEEGYYRVTDRAVPVIGCPFIGKPRTHNAYTEVSQLAQSASRLIGGAGFS